MLKLLFP